MRTGVSRCCWCAEVYSALLAFALGSLLVGCTVTTDGPPSDAPQPGPPVSESPAGARRLSPEEAERLRRVMLPLLPYMNHPLSPGQVQIAVLNDHDINAANAGSGTFYVTLGLLEQADDRRLQGVMAHELAHADLNHVSQLQTRAAGVGLGVLLATFALDQLLPGSGEMTSQFGQVAGQYYLASYSRGEEYDADAHGVELLRRAGYDGKGMMIDTLSWLRRTTGAGGGGFFATHPETGDRVAQLRRRP